MFPPSRVLPALPGTPAPATPSASSGQLWTPGANGMSTPMGAGTGTGTSGLQFPMKLGAGPMGAQSGPGIKSSAPSTPQPTRDGSVDPEKDDKHPTDVDSLMDAVGISGVNIDAEEDALRIANEKLHQASVPSGPSVDRSRKQDFIDPNVLAECVKKIAAAFQLRTLEPDTIPFIALATRHRLAQLIHAAIAARDHRIHSSHFRPPPMSSSLKRKRNGSDEETSEGEEEDEERRRRKGKGKELGAGWDQVIHDDQEKILQVLEKVEREEERKKRRERMLRDEREREQRELEEEIRLSEAANAELGGNSGLSALDKLVTGGNTASGSATPKEVELGKDGKPKKEKKKKKDGPGNLALDHAKKLTDQVAMRSIGGRSFTWATQGNSGFASPTPGGLNTPGSALPRPKFAGTSASGLPPPNFGTPLSRAAFPALSTTFSNTSASFDPLARLTNVPPLHDANRTEVQKAEWERNKKVVELGDVTFALERERGMGVGRGSGRNVLIRSRSGLRGGGHVWRGR